MKVRLKNNGGYNFGDGVDLTGHVFNAYLEVYSKLSLAFVSGYDLLQAGADPMLVGTDELPLPFYIGLECIVVEE